MDYKTEYQRIETAYGRLRDRLSAALGGLTLAQYIERTKSLEQDNERLREELVNDPTKYDPATMLQPCPPVDFSDPPETEEEFPKRCDEAVNDLQVDDVVENEVSLAEELYENVNEALRECEFVPAGDMVNLVRGLCIGIARTWEGNEMLSWIEKDQPSTIKQRETVFVEHIQEHLSREQEVCCKICDQTIDEIYQKYLEKYNESGNK